jgi:hypothetical protein
MAAAACTGIVEAPDEGSGSSTGVAVCSSNTYWKDMNTGSEFMHPGGKCNTCHDMNPMTAPAYIITGTVYPTSHEPDDCNGVNGVIDEAGLAEVTVVITDRTGRTKEPLPVNSAGNFKFAGEILMPFNVKVVSKGKENKMSMQSSSGDCNSCHTQNGDAMNGSPKAPGRITMP